MGENKTSTYFKIIKSNCFIEGSALMTDKPVSVRELEQILCDSVTRIEIIPTDDFHNAANIKQVTSPDECRVRKKECENENLQESDKARWLDNTTTDQT